MSFFKKLLGTTDLTPEEKTKQEAEKAAKKAQKEKEFQEWKEMRLKEKESKKEQKMKQIEKFFGPNPSFSDKTNYSLYKSTFEYLEKSILSSDEKVLATIPAEYDKTKKKEIKGVLVATDQQLIFGIITPKIQYVETFDYKKMVGVSLKSDGLFEKELHINFARSTKKFDDIVNDNNFKRFLNAVQDQIATHKKMGTKRKSTDQNGDKYKQLEQLGKLKKQGILTEEEFEREKQKILNS